jgi:hypothetical protein
MIAYWFVDATVEFKPLFEQYAQILKQASIPYTQTSFKRKRRTTIRMQAFNIPTNVMEQLSAADKTFDS